MKQLCLFLLFSGSPLSAYSQIAPAQPTATVQRADVTPVSLVQKQVDAYNAVDPQRPSSQAVAVYKVENGLIKKVYFTR